MAQDGQQSASLTARFEAFQILHPLRDTKARKEAARSIEREVRLDQLMLSASELQQSLTSNYELARIVVYLLIENERANSDPKTRLSNVLSEWERFRRTDMNHDASRMPLYYAIRAYVSFLRNSSELRRNSTGDSAIFLQMDAVLAKSELDKNSQVRERVLEVLALLGTQAGPQVGTNSDPAWFRLLRELPKWAIVAVLIYVAVLVSYSVYDNRRVDFWPPAIHSRTPAAVAETSSLKAQLDDTTWVCSSPKCDPNPKVKARIWLIVKLQNEQGQIAEGQVLGVNTITYGALRGTISKDLRSISWDNDTAWTRP